MFRKLDQWLLTRYPLLWNMRAHWIFPVIIIAHILFYVSGYLNPVSIKTLDHYYYISHDDGVVAMSWLLAVLLMIIWLVFYLRNNAFKSFYPLKKSRLFAEYVLLALIILGVSTFAGSWNKGFRDHVRLLTHDTDLKKEAEAVNLAMHFIPFSEDDFSIKNCCDTIRKYADSPYSSRRNSEYEDTLPEYHSYLYYCSREVSSLNSVTLRDKFEINEIAQRWLKEHKQDSVKWAMDEFLKVCNKYDAAYRFNTREESGMCFITPDFHVQHYISERRFNENRIFIEKDDVRSSLERIDEVRSQSWNYRELTAFLYLAICGALVVMSFRLTKLRPWFIAAISSGLWAMLFGLVGAMTSGEELLIIPLFLVLALVFLIYAAWNILKKRNKLFSALTFLWFTWSLPSLIPLFMALLLRVLANDGYVYDQAGNEEYVEPSLVYEWIQDHWGLINTCNLLLVVLTMAFVLIPLARKWQANPEE